MRIFTASFSVIVMMALAALLHGAGCSYTLFIILPYTAFVIFLTGMTFRLYQWLAAPLPFNITTTCGQQKSLQHIKNNPVDNPDSHIMAILRTMLDVILFRSLFRHTRWYRTAENLPVFGSDKWLWLGAMCFHWALLYALLHHLRFFIDTPPAAVRLAIAADTIFHIGTPGLYLTNAVLMGALLFLMARRFFPRIRGMSLYQDFFLLMLVIAAAGSGMLMRYFFRADLDSVRTYVKGMMALSPVLPAGPGLVFSIHIVLVSALSASIPFSKIVHSMAVLFSPTRLLPGSSRKYRHVNPWNAPVEVHGYAEWENEFREKLQKSGYTVERADGGKAE